MKVDNTGASRPKAGITAADVVYVEQAEGGLTRLAALFSTTLPPRVGPVRSARLTDLELLAQHGRVAFAHSGANAGVRASVRDSPLWDVSLESGREGYAREPRNPPYNLFANPAVLLTRAPQAEGAKDVGFTFGPPPPGGQPVSAGAASYPAARIEWGWSPDGQWLLSTDGKPEMAAEGGQLSAATVVVQYVDVVPGSFQDRRGQVSPDSRTVGSGPAVVFRDGQAFEAEWTRPAPEHGTSFTTNGQPVPFAAGTVWILLVDKNQPIAYS